MYMLGLYVMSQNTSQSLPSLTVTETVTPPLNECPNHDLQLIRRTRFRRHCCVVYCIHSLTHPHTARTGCMAHTSVIQTFLLDIGGVLVRSCSGANLRLPEIPRRSGGKVLSALLVSDKGYPLLRREPPNPPPEHKLGKRLYCYSNLDSSYGRYCFSYPYA